MSTLIAIVVAGFAFVAGGRLAFAGFGLASCARLSALGLTAALDARDGAAECWLVASRGEALISFASLLSARDFNISTGLSRAGQFARLARRADAGQLARCAWRMHLRQL